MIDTIFNKLSKFFGTYSKLEISFKVLSMLIGLGYVIYVYAMGTGLGTMVPRYAGY